MRLFIYIMVTCKVSNVAVYETTIIPPEVLAEIEDLVATL